MSFRIHVSDIAQHNHKDIQHTYPAQTAPLEIGTMHYITLRSSLNADKNYFIQYYKKYKYVERNAHINVHSSLFILLIRRTSAWVVLYSKMVLLFDFVPHILHHFVYSLRDFNGNVHKFFFSFHFHFLRLIPPLFHITVNEDSLLFFYSKIC